MTGPRGGRGRGRGISRARTKSATPAAPRAWLHLCKDGTISVRREGEPSFNGVAFPVLECANEQEAKDVQILTCKLMREPHGGMKPGEPWFKLGSGPFPLGFSGEYEDVAVVEQYLAECLARVRARPRRTP